MRATWASPEKRLVSVPSVQYLHAVKPAIPRANAIHDAKACGSSDHRNSSSFKFACLEHKCSKCKGALDPKGHNKNNCPQILSTICTLCEEVGHDEERCPTRPCPACGNRTHKSPTHFECPEHICATCGEKGHNRTNCPTTQCETCGLFGHLPNDCPFVNWQGTCHASPRMPTFLLQLRQRSNADADRKHADDDPLSGARGEEDTARLRRKRGSLRPRRPRQRGWRGSGSAMLRCAFAWGSAIQS